MNKDSKIYVAGHKGLVGSALMNKLESGGYWNLITRTSSELDLRRQDHVEGFFEAEKPEYVFLAAAKVGGILANSIFPGEFLYDNIMIQTNVLECARTHNVKKLLFLGSSCIYPRNCPQPIREEYLLSGSLEETNEFYAIAKITGIKMCQAYRKQYGCNYIAVMPTNLYGPKDNFDPKTSHVLPALIRKFHEAKLKSEPTVLLWGNGTAKREFLHTVDLAEACLLLMDTYDEEEIVNVGSGEELTIRDLAELIKTTIGYSGEIWWDGQKIDGTPRKLLCVEKLKRMGWRPSINLETGIAMTYADFLRQSEGEGKGGFVS